ncbi:MAG: dihydrolipoamide acetyltransferase family protein [Anaerolineae bacterium]
MATPVILPKLGNSVESSIISRWLKRKGEPVTLGEPLFEIETDKTTQQVDSPASGSLLDVYFAEGEDVPVLTTIALIGEVGEVVPHPPTPSPTRGEGGKVVPHPPAPSPTRGEGGKRESVEASPRHPVTPSLPPVGVSPRARNLAARKGLDLAGVPGSGPGGRVIERDVQAALAARPTLTPLARAMVERGEYVPPEQGSGVGGRITSKDLQAGQAPLHLPPSTGGGPEMRAAVSRPQWTGGGSDVGSTVPLPPLAGGGRVVPGDDFERVPLTNVRRIIAERMLASLQTTAQLTLNSFADARAIQAYRKRLKGSADELGLRDVTVNDLVLFAVSRTLPQFPDVNALFTGDALLQARRVHLGFAVDTPRGLLVPVIRNADSLSLREMSQAARRLGQAATQGKVAPDELQGGTFTVTNLGALGIETFTPVLNPPQVAILGVGSIHLKPVEVDGDVQFIPHIALSLTINHQVVDGAPGARFLQALARNLANLDLLLAV